MNDSSPFCSRRLVLASNLIPFSATSSGVSVTYVLRADIRWTSRTSIRSVPTPWLFSAPPLTPVAVWSLAEIWPTIRWVTLSTILLARIRAVARHDRLSEVKYFRRTSKDTWITFLLRAYAPMALLRPYRRVFRNSRHLSGRSSMPWIRRPDRQLEPRSRQGADSKARHADGLQVSAEIILRWSLRAYDQARFGALDVTTAFAGTEQRLPYVDRRIIEFALRMPLHLACSKGLNRVVLREGMRGLLPDAIRLRVPKPGLSQLVERGWQNERNAS